MFFLLGSLVEETPCEHGENMQTPQKGPGDSPPEHCALWGGPAPQSQQRPMRHIMSSVIWLSYVLFPVLYKDEARNKDQHSEHNVFGEQPSSVF